MKDLIEKYKFKINSAGITTNEFKIISFLLIFLIIGTLIQSLESNEKAELKSFDYKKIDSLFKTKNFDKSILFEKKVDNKDKLSNLSEDKIFKNVDWESALFKNPVNINIDGLERLKLLPGIGEKTALKIIKYRKENGLFKNKKEILKVKGIGIKKYEKIKNFIKIK